MRQHGKWLTKLREKILSAEMYSMQFYKYLIEHAIKSSKSRIIILDAGCGENPSVEKYDNALTIGTDINWILKKSKSLDYLIICSLEALPFKSGVFDLIVNRWVIEHLENKKYLFPLIQA